jgi:YqaJ-like viral recombinase domain
MRIIDIQQQTEEWERWRNRPTASEFSSFITPARGDYSAQATGYAAKIVAKQLGVYTEPPPTYWMEWGNEHEPNAKHAYTQHTGRAVVDVGFILPDGTDAYGGSPDGLVGDDGLIEIKCPAPETLINYHANGTFPVQYRPQVQGLLLISGRLWCDFFVFHPELTPFLIRVEPDYEYQTKMAVGLLELLKEIKRIESCVQRQEHEAVAISTMTAKVRFDDE